MTDAKSSRLSCRVRGRKGRCILTPSPSWAEQCVLSSFLLTVSSFDPDPSLLDEVRLEIRLTRPGLAFDSSGPVLLASPHSLLITESSSSPVGDRHPVSVIWALFALSMALLCGFPVATAGPAAVSSALTVLSRALVVLFEMAVARRLREPSMGFDALRPKALVTNPLELVSETWEMVVMSSLLSSGRAAGISSPLSKLHASFFVSDDDRVALPMLCDDDRGALPTLSTLPCRLTGALTCPALRREENLRLAFSFRPSIRVLAALDAE
mmetsp:Transcript_19273/g.42858  ORF Transcript_19273/g.42858 Transcript_19273/m.42858 type:complete len:268 (+) Transcript_19273:556-1359(+)